MRFIKYLLMITFIGIAIFALNQMSHHAQAADIVWDGGGVDDLASTKENWVGDVAPQAYDNLIFDSTSAKSCTYDLAVTIDGFRMNGYIGILTIDSQFTVTKMVYLNGNIFINSGKYIIFDTYNGAFSFTNLGIISGPGQVLFNVQVNRNVDLGTIRQIQLYSIAGSDMTLFLNDTANIDTLEMRSYGTFKMSLNKNGQSLYVKNITTSYSPLYGYLSGNGNVFFQGGIINIGNGVIDNATIIGDSTIINGMDVSGKLILNAQWTGNIFYNGTADVQTDQQYWTGWLYTDNDVKIVYNTASYLQMNHDTWLGLQINSWSGTNNFTWNMTGTESNVQFACSRMTGNGIYDVYRNGIYTQSIEASPSGIVGFTTDVTTGDYLISRSTAIFTDDSQFGIWMILIFFLILTIISFVAYAMHIGLLNIITLIIMMIAIPLSNDLWTEYWPFVLMFGLVNAILVLMTWMRK